jgi:hypothetical protein
MKTSIVSLFPTHQSAGLAHNWSSRPALVRQSEPFTRNIETPVPALRILRSPAGQEKLFNYAVRANNARWESFVFASLALCALTALVMTLGALIAA